MSIERKVREHLHETAETIECPPAISKRIKQSYSHYLQQKRSEKTMKKRLIGGIVAAAFLIPTAAFAAPAVIELLTRTPMTAEQVTVDEIGNATLEKLYSAFPETKSFEIIDASNVQGVQTSITLQENGGTGKKITLHTNGTTGAIEHVIQENWEPKDKPLTALTDQEIKAKVDHLIEKMYGNSNAYEVAIEQMENPDQKTFMLNYTKKGSTAPFYQVFVQGDSISASLIGGETTPSNTKVEGFFTTNGKPDYFGDAFLNDEKLFSLLNMSGTELKQELAKGKSVVEVAASKNVSRQQVIDVIAKSQVDIQMQGEKNGEVPKSNASNAQMLKAIEPKVLQVIEYKSEATAK
ncbi:hypothetical protein BRE01_23010 [Brevibacillus reuszeri]|uniref:DUF4179 domain-containing protein n=2 Tax=Brevibacillus reuszeri TaxID=54915 RepID=A0ABQ0TL34_9BACL|nr:hypothetical protein [Brevibacillus reuszeri]MED1858400.1 hypothetical protein [Brevibacillus reuszeri]GED68599.1 hypothetical protein BRE01_23010 [Brevibacillus reuszeri]